MNPSEVRVASAVLQTPTSGSIELTGDWRARGLPKLSLAERPHRFAKLTKEPDFNYGFAAGFFVDRAGALVFCFDPSQAPSIDWRKTPVYVAGSFNGWQAAVGAAEWRLQPEEIGGRTVLVRRPDAKELLGDPNHQFKFVTENHLWIDVPPGAPNAVWDSGHNCNYGLTVDRTGHHRFVFELREPLDLSLPHAVLLKSGEASYAADLQPGRFFFDLKTDLPLGAIVSAGETTFRLFAPRASSVKVTCFETLEEAGSSTWEDLKRLADGAWETAVPGDRHGWFYWFRVDGPKGPFSHFEPDFNILDPYALATVGREGPGIVLDPARLAIEQSFFKPPGWHDLIIVEAHVRDLLAHSQHVADSGDRTTFAGLPAWVDHRNCYFKRLGVNAVELQPVQEFDDKSPDEYHWGYMTVNYFAPESSYGREPEKASQVVELQQAVEAFHRNGFAVILDVVYNHVGEPNHLYLIDKLYYFEQSADGTLANWSGCGNDLRCSAAMARRLIIDSLVHLATFYGVDGFRFDLAELIGIDVLKEIEVRLKKVKPHVILIAEPWSFRGHIAAGLRETGFASWNDGFRNFLRDYARARASHDAAAYYLRGSPWHFARWPAQTVNYVESHDDRTWIDVITENPGNNGFNPAINDVRRTHLMVAFLMSSIGIPMLSAGQDFLRSKHGVNNSYQRGDLNALDYHRIYRRPGTHAYFASWIRFRLGRWGRMMRHHSRPMEGFLEVFHAPDGIAIAAVYNANGSLGPARVLFAINPHPHDVAITIGEFAGYAWRQVADHEHFFAEPDENNELVADGRVTVPELGCGLWVAGG
ncbi:MAG: alpha-amylase family glycosyl hydrolase [Opitutaceae bacterium]